MRCEVGVNTDPIVTSLSPSDSDTNVQPNGSAFLTATTSLTEVNPAQTDSTTSQEVSSELDASKKHRSTTTFSTSNVNNSLELEASEETPQVILSPKLSESTSYNDPDMSSSWHNKHSPSGQRKRAQSFSGNQSSPNQSPWSIAGYTSWVWPQSTHSKPKILFYHKHNPYYGFTNFSSHQVYYKGKLYPTSEHLFQSFKFHGHRPDLAEHIRTCSDRPSVAFSEARRFQAEVRHDWKHVNIEKMDITLHEKFTQNANLRAELLSTGDAELVEDSDKDAFWGVGTNGRGRNELGKALERLRDDFRRGRY